MTKQCADCKWCKSLEDSLGKTIYFCMDAHGGAYLQETGLLGHCEYDARFDKDDPVHASGGIYCRECEHIRSGGSPPFFGTYCSKSGSRVDEDDFCSNGEIGGGNDDPAR